MLRPLFLLAAIAGASPAAAQPAAGGSEGCRVTVNATPSSWMIDGYDPFGSDIPEGVFGVTFTNASTSECRFSPIFQLDEPPHGLARGLGRRIRFALLNLTDSRDATPRVARTVRTPSQRDIVLAPNQSETVMYRLVADPDDIPGAGIYTQNVTLEAQDAQLRSVGGARVVLGLNVLPSARLGLTGAYKVDNGHALVDLGTLQEGPAPVPLNLHVNSTGPYNIRVSSANAGRLRLASSNWYVPYRLEIDGTSIPVSGSGTVSSSGDAGMRQDFLPVIFHIGDVADRRAGTYSDVISISVAAR